MQCRLSENENISPDFAFMSVTNEFPFLKVKWENVKHTRTGRKKGAIKHPPRQKKTNLSKIKIYDDKKPLS